MSEAKWCDHGNHAFSAREEGTQTITVTQQVKDAYGRYNPVSISKDICRKCSNAIGSILEIESDSPEPSGKPETKPASHSWGVYAK